MSRVDMGTAAALARKLLWRCAFAVTGGIRRTGELPAGPAVLVANHGSHADTAALLAALPSRRRPVAAAAADYWFGCGWRRWVVRTVITALPIPRGNGGGYDALRAAAAPELARGKVVVIFPEGTRTTDGSLGRFRSGAIRLAADSGVPVIPVALVGTRELLPKHGRIRPQAVEVRFGRPVLPGELSADEEGAAQLRAEVQRLRDAGPAAASPSPLWSRATAFASGRALLPVAFLWAMAEALSWPIVVEMYLVLFAVCLPRRVLPAALALVAGSVTGVVVHAAAVRYGLTPPLPLTTARMAARAAADLSGGPSGIWAQAVNGVPVKVYAHEAGRAGLDLAALALHTAVGRGARILTVAVALTGAAWLVRPLLRRWYGTYVMSVSVLFAVLLHRVVQHWA